MRLKFNSIYNIKICHCVMMYLMPKSNKFIQNKIWGRASVSEVKTDEPLFSSRLIKIVITRYLYNVKIKEISR